MAILKYSDLADSGLFIRTNTKGVAHGVASLGSDGKVPTDQLPSGISDGGTGTSNSFTFKVNYSGSNPNTVTELPVGWSAVVGGSNVTITHNVGTFPKLMTFLGYNNDSSPASLKYRVPSAANEMIIVDSTKNSIFTFAITTAVTASSLSQYALVTVLF
jgi:hypothetical protein